MDPSTDCRRSRNRRRSSMDNSSVPSRKNRGLVAADNDDLESVRSAATTVSVLTASSACSISDNSSNENNSPKQGRRSVQFAEFDQVYEEPIVKPKRAVLPPRNTMAPPRRHGSAPALGVGSRDVSQLGRTSRRHRVRQLLHDEASTTLLHMQHPPQTKSSSANLSRRREPRPSPRVTAAAL